MEGHDQPSVIKYTFRKEERLHNKKMIKELFDKGSSFFLYPFKIFYLQDLGASERNKILISVSKKIYKRSVDRNLIKRQIKEAYRLNKTIVANHEKNKQPLLIGFIFVAKQILTFKEIESKLKSVLLRLQEVRSK